jgi:7-cyano-7-deazaguanine synthase
MMLIPMTTTRPTRATGQPDHPDRPRAIVLVSGGLDSATTLAIAAAEGFACHALVFDYGQRHRIELDAADRVARAQQAEAITRVRLDPDAFQGSALTTDLAVPKDRSRADLESHTAGDIPVTYVPARNLVFLSYATALAESVGANDIYLGVNAVDYSGYPDCRPVFIEAFERAAQLATRAGARGSTLRIHVPLMDWSKAQIITRGVELGVDFALTHSCYDPDKQGRACGHCDSCQLRRAGFERAHVADPTVYAPQ